MEATLIEEDMVFLMVLLQQFRFLGLAGKMEDARVGSRGRHGGMMPDDLGFRTLYDG